MVPISEVLSWTKFRLGHLTKVSFLSSGNVFPWSKYPQKKTMKKKSLVPIMRRIWRHCSEFLYHVCEGCDDWTIGLQISHWDFHDETTVYGTIWPLSTSKLDRTCTRRALNIQFKNSMLIVLLGFTYLNEVVMLREQPTVQTYLIITPLLLDSKINENSFRGDLTDGPA